MDRFRIVLIFAIGFALAGCGGPGTEQVVSAALPNPAPSDSCPTASSKGIFFAADMCPAYRLSPNDQQLTTPADADRATDGGKTKIAFISAALVDSQTKCNNLIKKMTQGQAGENIAFDTAAILLSGIAAGISGPASTIRGLAAGSTAVQGFKQTINSDLFQNMAISAFINGINNSYYQAIDTMFGSSDLSNFTAADAYWKIIRIHRNCSLPVAAANMNANQPKTTPGASVTVTITGRATLGDAVSLNATSSSQSINQAISYKVGSGDDLEGIASNLILDILSDLSTAGVSTSGWTPSGTGVQFTVKGGPSDLKWSSTTATTLSEKVNVQ